MLDTDTGRVLLRSPVSRHSRQTDDPNPRGGSRGARGMSVWADRLVIANAERLFVLDRSWRLVNELTHPWMGGNHDILAAADGVWVTCTSADLLVKFSWEGRPLVTWEWRGDEHLKAAFGLEHVPRVDRTLDYRDPVVMRSGVRNCAHVNSVNGGSSAGSATATATLSSETAPTSTGAAAGGLDGLVVSLGRIMSPSAYRRAWLRGRVLDRLPGAAHVADRASRWKTPALKPTDLGRIEHSRAAIVRLRDNGHAEMLNLVKDVGVPNHNVIETPDAVIFNDSNACRLVAAPLDGIGPIRTVRIPGNPSFPRGLAERGQAVFYVGSQAPAAVYEVNLTTRQIAATFDLDGEHHETVYGVCVLPDDFNDPPPRIAGLGCG